MNSKNISSRAVKGDATSACFVASQEDCESLTLGKFMWRLVETGLGASCMRNGRTIYVLRLDL